MLTDNVERGSTRATNCRLGLNISTGIEYIQEWTFLPSIYMFYEYRYIGIDSVLSDFAHVKAVLADKLMISYSFFWLRCFEIPYPSAVEFGTNELKFELVITSNSIKNKAVSAHP